MTNREKAYERRTFRAEHSIDRVWRAA